MPNSAALCPLPPPRPTRRKTRHPPPGRRPFSQSSSVSLCLRGEILHHARPRANYDAHRCQTVRLCVLCHLCAPPEGRRVTHRSAGGHSRSHPPYLCASVVNLFVFLRVSASLRLKFFITPGRERIMTPTDAKQCGSVSSAISAPHPKEDAPPTARTA